MSVRALAPRAPTVLLGLLLIGLVVGVDSAHAQASPPARYYGTVTANGGPPVPGTRVVASINGVICASGAVEFYGAYQLDIGAGCGPAGAPVAFTVGGVPAPEAAPFQPGYFVHVDLTAPTEAVTLVPGCNNVALTWPDGTSAATVAEAASAQGAAVVVWRYDAASDQFAAFASWAPQASDLEAVKRLDAVFLCVSASATLLRPAS